MSGGQEVGVCVGSRPMDTPQQERGKGKGKSREDSRSLIGSGAQTPIAAKAFLVTLPFEDFQQRVIMLVALPLGEGGRGALGVIGRQEAHRSLPSRVLTPPSPPLAGTDAWETGQGAGAGSQEQGAARDSKACWGARGWGGDAGGVSP